MAKETKEIKEALADILRLLDHERDVMNSS